MNRHYFLILCGLLGWLSVLTVRAQDGPSIHFTHIGLTEGLSQSTVQDIAQDEMGNMWIATQNGLNRYNGYDFTVYHHDETDSTSIANDYIYTIETDSRERIWIGTEEGLSYYDPYKDCFRNFPLKDTDKHTPVSGIAELDSLHLLLVSGGNLHTFHISEGTFRLTSLPGFPTEAQVYSVHKQQDVIYIGTDTGLYLYTTKEKTVSKLPCKEIEGKNILTALRQAPRFLWIATEGDGLYRFDLQTKKTRQYATHTPHYLESDFVRSLALDSQNRLWAGTFTSLNIYDSQSDNFQCYTSDPTTPGSLSQASVRCIFRDKQEGMWLGTYFGGLNYYHPLRNRFLHLCQLPGKKSLNNNVISCITEGEDKQLWIGSKGGVNVYNPQRETFRYYTVRDGLKSDDIKAICLDKDRQTAYIGSHAGGLSVLHIPSGRIETIAPSRFTTDEKSVYILSPKGDDELWVGTLDGLKRFDKRTKAFLPYSLPAEREQQSVLRAEVQFFFQDSRQRLWIGGKEGFGIFRQTDDNGLEYVPLLPSDHQLSRQEAFCVYEQNDGTYYIGTRNGLFRFNEHTAQTKHYTTRDGLPSNVIYGILRDGYGKLWMSTEQGLSCFTPDTEAFRNFNDDDGLQSNQFTPYAYARTSEGHMYFGGVNGLTSFYPETMTNNPYVPSPVFTQLRLFNQEVRPGDATGILAQHISRTSRLTLKSGQSMFSITFAVPNYVAGSHNSFAYCLEGYDKEWYETRTRRTVSYSNLPHGNYRFLVKAANNDGKWNETPATLEIRILPVWYRTWWATLLFVAAAIGSVTFIIRYFWSQKVMKAQIEMERVDKERQKEVNEMKLRFFINISHELRTPLTLILAPLQDLLMKVNDRWTRKQLELIQLNTNRLLHLVNQLMDYRRAELGVFQLKVRRVPVHQIVEKNFRFYERIAQRKQIDYNFYSEVEGKDVLCDPEYVELIENNLLSNAFKYTGEGKSITVTLKEADGQLVLQVKDTGNGIPADKQERIFERFYQGDDEHLGSGIGLSLVQRLVELHHGRIELESREGAGSTFTISLPCDEKAYKPEEKAGDNHGTATEEIHTTNLQEMYAVDLDGTAGLGKDAENVPEENSEKQRDENILIVEDNTDIRQYLADELGRNYSVWQAENGEQALELLKKQPIDLVLTDVMMPVMDGLQLCKHIKQNLSTCHIPVIILSAKADIKEQLEGLQVGADDYIPKPFAMNVVAAKIRNLFRTRRRAIEYYSQSMDIEPEKIALNPMDEKLLKQAMEIMEKHMDDVDFTTDEFAREMCMSRSNLHLKMKALTGESTNEFIRKMRFNKACKLLKEGTYTIAEISTMVGFSTPSYFSTSFKKHFGCLPSEYGK